MQVPGHYKGREQSYIKHLLLKTYLEKLFMIIGQHQSTISYVDCFAGPWEEQSEDLSDTSIAISLQIMKKCRDGLKKAFNRDVRFRAFFIELNPKSFKKLTAYLEANKFEGIEIVAQEGDFLNLRDAIVKWAGSSFSFFFIDPLGWEDIQISHLKPLLQRQNSEYLINFMYDFVSRFCEKSDLADKIVGMFGSQPNVSDLDSKEREELLLSLYCSNARAIAGADSYFGRVNVLDPCADRTKYHLIYISRHPLGLVKFIDSSEMVEGIQRNVRKQAKQDKKIERSGQGEFFDTDQVEPHDQKSEMRDFETIAAAKAYWLRRLSKEERRYQVVDLARMLDETGWFIGDFQSAFKDLEKEGRVKNLDATRMRPKNAVNFDKGERLALL